LKGRRNDFLVGLFILISIGVIVGAMALTSGIGEGRYPIYLRSETAENLNQDTRVVVQGLTIGRVAQVNPVVDSSSGELSFVAMLSIRDEFPDGSVLRLPVGTRAVIAQPTPIEAPVVLLAMPQLSSRIAYLEPGDTLPSERRPGVLDALGDMASTLKEEIPVALEETRRLMELTATTLTEAGALLASTRPRAEEVMDRLATNLELTENLVATEAERLGPLQDSLTLVLADARTTLQRFDSLASIALAMSRENRETIRLTIQQLQRSATILEYFAEQMSRRPLRFLTGVTPPPPDSGVSQP
jgi:ABC-type transporter Mla subunit MlaD